MSDASLFRDFLHNELDRRVRNNSRYSLRAMARSLRTDSSTLSQFLRGKRQVSPRKQLEWGALLGLTPARLGDFFGPEVDRSLGIRQKLSREERKLSLDEFQLIADWWHYAILELFTIEEAQTTPEFIAERLGISTHEARDALDRLERLKLVERRSDGGLERREFVVSSANHVVASAAQRHLQMQILEQAMRALEETPPERRDHSSMTFAISSQKLGEARELIAQFRRRLVALLQDSDTRDEVYELSIALFPVSG